MRFMLKLLLRFLGLILGVSMASMIGVLSYARHDPQYSCLNFDNVTIQLDTSLFVRDRIPLWHPSSNRAPSGESRVMLQMTSRGLYRANLTNPVMWYPDVSYTAVIQSNANIQRLVLETDIYNRNFHENWWPENERLIYTWQSYSDRQWYMSVYDTEHFRHLLKVTVGSRNSILGWTADGRYSIVDTPTPSNIQVVDTIEGKRQLYDLGVDTHFLNTPAFWEHRASFVAQGNLYLIDLDAGTQTHYPMIAAPEIPVQVQRWSPNGEYVYTAYNTPTEMFFNLARLEEDGLSTISHQQFRLPDQAQFLGWSANSLSMFYGLRIADSQELREIDLVTGKYKVIAPRFYQGLVQSGGLLFSAPEDIMRLYFYNPTTQESWQLLEAEYAFSFYLATPRAVLVIEPVAYVEGNFIGKIPILNQEGQFIATISTSREYTYTVNPTQNTIMVVDGDSQHAKVKSTMYDLETGEATTLPDIPLGSVDVNYSLIWIPESQDWLLLIGEPFVPKTNLYRLDTEAGKAVPLAVLPNRYNPEDNNIAWSPDGKYLLAAYPTLAGFELVVIELDGEGWHSLGRFEKEPSFIQWTQCTY
jgi:hypothetical protein